MVQTYPPFSLKSLADHFNLRIKTQLLHYIVSHQTLPVAFTKTVGYEATATSRQQTRITVLE